MKRCSGVSKCKSTVFFALDCSLWVVRDLSCYLVHHLMILPRTDPLGPTALAVSSHVSLGDDGPANHQWFNPAWKIVLPYCTTAIVGCMPEVPG